MRANLFVVLAAGALALAPAAAEAWPNHCYSSTPTPVMSAIGDSISVGCDSWDDACSTMTQYASRLGNDWQSSWTVGDLTTATSPSGYSVRKRLSNLKGSATWVYYPAGEAGTGDYTAPNPGLDTDGVAGTEVFNYAGTNAFSNPIIAPHNGAAWVDAANQAYAIYYYCYYNPSTCPKVVTVELGGNSVCQTSCANVPTTATVQSNIDLMTTYLSYLPAGTEVWVNTMPDLAYYKSLLQNKKNWVFKNCQALWNIDTGQIAVNTCDISIFGWDICDVTDWLAKVSVGFLDWLWDLLIDIFDVKFPCWTVLNSNSSCKPYSSNPTTTALNTYINNYLITKFCYGGVNSDGNCANTGTWYGNTHFFLARHLMGLQFTDKHVSTLDCFHPNRKGQEAIANTFWQDLCQSGINVPVNCSGPSPTTSPTLTTVYDGYQAKYKNQLNINSTCNRSRVRIFTRGTGNDQRDVQTIETNTFADNHQVTFNVATPGYYYVYYELVDEYQTSGITGSGGKSYVQGRKYPMDYQDPNTHVVTSHATPVKVGSSYYYLR